MSWYHGNEYVIQRPDSTIIFGGGRRFSSTSISPTTLAILTVEHAEVGNADDTTIDPSVSQFLHTFLPSQFSFTNTLGTEPPVESIREWTGIMGFSHDLHPYIGSHPDSPNKWVIGGFHGHGMVRIFLSAKALAQQLLSPHPTPWPPWLPKAYIYPPHHKRHTIDEILHYLPTPPPPHPL
jgi:glycine/D-amino acid oxidase-like deaminating enzyme